jgi:hypothetical protein
MRAAAKRPETFQAEFNSTRLRGNRLLQRDLFDEGHVACGLHGAKKKRVVRAFVEGGSERYFAWLAM